MFRRNLFSPSVFFHTALVLVFVFEVSVFSAPELYAQAKTREQMEQELQDLEKQIEEHKKNAENKSKESASLSRDLSILQEKINKSKKAIKAHDLAISKISSNIKVKDSELKTLDQKLEAQKVSLAQILRKQNSLDSHNVVNFAFSEATLSSFFSDDQSFGALESAITSNLTEIEQTKNTVNKTKEQLEEAKYEELAEKQKQSLEIKEVSVSEAEKKQLLNITKGQEAAYKKIVADRTARAQQLRSALFELNDAKDISFGRAVEIATKVGDLTGVRPAFILGIIRIESNLGQNVGKGTWKEDMHPTRDQPVFEKLMEKLGLDPDKQPVSKKVWYGYGGAMGPAQFIPSTWVMYEKRITKITGNDPPSPWNVEDAFTAAALLLKDNGAVYGDRAKEHRAAMCYLAGCGNAKKASLQFYGDNVLKYAKEYEEQMELLK